MRYNELFPRRDTQKRVEVPAFRIGGRGAFLADSNSTPQFIHLERVHGEVADKSIVQSLASLAYGFQHVQDGVRVAVRQPGTRPHANALGEQFDDLNHFGVVNPQAV
jgi:hypothetical protein